MKDEIRVRLVINGFKKLSKLNREDIVKWLRETAKQIKKAKPQGYVKNPRWTLYK